MPIKHVALKQLKKNAKRAERNQALRSELRTLKKRFLGLLQANKRDDAQLLLPTVVKRFSQAASRGLIHANVASRTSSRLMKRLSARPATAPSRHETPTGQAGTASTPAAPAPSAATPPGRS